MLWSKILDSSVWMESKETRLVWITLLAMKDNDGVVLASPKALAHRARVEIEECTEALRIFLKPDPESSSKIEEGRRLREVPGGWQIINHEMYRFSTEAKREFWREQKREQRATPKEEQIYDAYPRKVGKMVALKSIAKAIEKHGFDFVLEKTKAYAAARNGQESSFTPYPSTWFNQERYNDDAKEWTENKGMSGADKMIMEKERERVEKRMLTIKNQYEGHQDWDDDDKQEYKELREQRDQLRSKLGLPPILRKKR